MSMKNVSHAQEVHSVLKVLDLHAYQVHMPLKKDIPHVATAQLDHTPLEELSDA